MTPALACGHRGNGVDTPEQTLVAYHRAIDLGAARIELDVRRTADDRLAVIHDATLERTSDGRGRVDQYTLAELRGLDAGGWFGPAFAGARIPTVGEVVDMARERGVRLCVEVKGDDEADALPTAELLADELAALGAIDEVWVSSFHLGALVAAARRRPGLHLLPWMDEFSPADVPAHLADARRLGADGVFHTASLLDRGQVAELQAAGLAVWVWCANDRDAMQQALDLRPDVVSCSDIAGLVGLQGVAP